MSSAMNNDAFAVVLITTPREKAEHIARELVKSRLIACVNIIHKVKSIYWWEGRIEESDESLLICKTKSSLINKLIEKVKELHPYEVPEIIALNISTGFNKYLEWVEESTA